MAVTKYAGVDLSYCQQNVDYKALKKGLIKDKPVKFAMLRIGYGTKKDSMFDIHYAGCKKAGIHVGVYQYSIAKNVAEAREEARWLLNELRNYQIDYPIAFDFEDYSVFQLGLSTAQYTAIVKNWLDIVKKANYYPILYAGKYVINDHINRDAIKDYDIWLAQYTSEGNEAKLGQTMWQFSVAGSKLHDYAKQGSVAGVIGECDINWSYVGYASKIKKLGMNKTNRKIFKIEASKIVEDDADGSGIDISLLEKNGYTVSVTEIDRKD